MLGDGLGLGERLRLDDGCDGGLGLTDKLGDGLGDKLIDGLADTIGLTLGNGFGEVLGKEIRLGDNFPLGLTDLTE